MSSSTAIEAILVEIEFELAQGIISEELGEGIEAIKRYQNKTRSQIMGKLKATDPHREILSRQFQTTDMLIALLQEMALNLKTMQLEIKRLHHLSSGEHPVETTSSYQNEGRYILKDSSDSGFLMSTWDLPPTDEIAKVMKLEAIHVDLHARPIQWPVIGWLLTKLKIFYQRPAFFYTQLLVNRQVEVNRTLGEHILQIESLLSHQQTQIEALKDQFDSLQPTNPQDPKNETEMQ